MDDHDAFASALAVVLEEITEERALWIGARVGDEQFTEERGLLRCAAPGEGEQPFVNQIEVDAFGVPTRIKVTRLLLGSDEAAVHTGADTTCKLQQAQSFKHPGQHLPPPRRVAESVKHVLPRGGVFAARKVAGITTQL